MNGHWKKVHTDKGGHRLFVDVLEGQAKTIVADCPRLWVADQSGPNPSLTDDGPLEIVYPLTAVELRPSHGHLVAHVPVKKNDRVGNVGLSAGCARYLAHAWAIPITIIDPETGETFYTAPDHAAAKS